MGVGEAEAAKLINVLGEVVLHVDAQEMWVGGGDFEGREAEVERKARTALGLERDLSLTLLLPFRNSLIMKDENMDVLEFSTDDVSWLNIKRKHPFPLSVVSAIPLSLTCSFSDAIISDARNLLDHPRCDVTYDIILSQCGRVVEHSSVWSAAQHTSWVRTYGHGPRLCGAMTESNRK
ncbi:hypothetical protein E2562_027985 [Oryza meyeriana var. granulata]|uniref:Uncharacterized protein n=1 Tax=Oryza meyeriana var. granulata TaxID=110450 RepID=A0A6G1CU08_9ORYZ|nr:hypothetical protein E2562_027985 [Oryza meyeriana var. granulata]